MGGRGRLRERRSDGSARRESFLKVADAGGFLAPLRTRLDLPPGLYRTLAVADSGRRWRNEGFRIDAVGVSEVAAIPLPLSASLMVAGLFGLAVVGRRRGAAGAKRAAA
jgi:hypothetical protein